MKTLTLFRAYLLAEDKNDYEYDMQGYGFMWRKRVRQVKYFKKALTKRLQEQEEMRTVCRLRETYPTREPSEVCEHLKVENK